MLYTDCPSSVRVSPSSGPFKAGDVLTCTSDGYPEPSYTWTDSNGVIVSTTNTVMWSEDWLYLTCTATGSFTSLCSASNTISGIQNVDTTDVTIGLGILFLAITLLNVNHFEKFFSLIERRKTLQIFFTPWTYFNTNYLSYATVILDTD